MSKIRIEDLKVGMDIRLKTYEDLLDNKDNYEGEYGLEIDGLIILKEMYKYLGSIYEVEKIYAEPKLVMLRNKVNTCEGISLEDMYWNMECIDCVLVELDIEVDEEELADIKIEEVVEEEVSLEQIENVKRYLSGFTTMEIEMELKRRIEDGE